MSRVKGTPTMRFWSSVVQLDECWDWAGTKLKSGYGAFYNGERTVTAHRWAYEYIRAEIPEGLHLDHLCRNRACVNPWHLDPVPPVVNVRRGRAGEVQRQKTHCPQGHEYTESNTYRSGGRRFCKTCRAAHIAKYQAKQRAKRA